MQSDFDSSELEEVRLLIQCLCIISRHFDNIQIIIRSNFINCTVEICHHLLNECSPKRMLLPTEQSLIKVCCEFLEFIYDPFLKWRHFTRTHQLSRGGSSYHVDPQLHPEIVPFIYTCFEDLQEDTKLSALHVLGGNLLHVLGAITIGSPRNARLVICPATINVIIKIISDWSMEESVRKRALANANLMLIMLTKSNPVERQIEVEIVVQEYMLAIQSLLKGRTVEPRDANALLSIVENITTLLSEPSTKISLCHALLDGNVISYLVEIPEKIHSWDIQLDEHMSAVVEAISLVSYSVGYQLPAKALKRLFQGLRQSTLESSDRTRIVQQCLSLATNPNDALVLNTMVVNELISWLPTLNRPDQELVIASLMDVCTRNSNR